jgi:hypothetical protein
MLKRIALVLTAVLLAGSLAGAPRVSATEQPEYRNGSINVDVTDTSITIGSSLVEQSWARKGFGTTSFYDKRGSGAGPVDRRSRLQIQRGFS